MDFERKEEKVCKVDREFADILTRIVRENHGEDLSSLEVCPFIGCNNLVSTCGGNELTIYDSCNRGNFVDIVSSFFNYPNNIEMLDKRRIYKDGKMKLTKEQMIKVTFNDITWINRDFDNDMYIAAACNDGNIYIISHINHDCILVFPASKHPIKRVLAHFDDKYSSRVLLSIDNKNIVKIWDIDDINVSNLDLDEKGNVINNGKNLMEPKVRISHELVDAVFGNNINNNDNDNDNTISLHGVTPDGKFRSYSINIIDNVYEDETVNGEDMNDSDTDMAEMNGNNNKIEEKGIEKAKEKGKGKGKGKEVHKWKFKSLIDGRIKFNSSSLRRAIAIKFRHGENDINHIICADSEGHFWLYDIDTNKVLHRFKTRNSIFDNNYSFDITLNGLYLVYGNFDGSTTIYDINNKKVFKRLLWERTRSNTINHARFGAPNEESIVIASESMICKYDTYQWVKEYQPTTSFFIDKKPFEKKIEAQYTFTDF